MDRPFASIYSHGYVRCAVCVPEVRVAAPGFNAGKTLELARRASDAGAAVALFPELGISAYTCDDLFHQDALLDAVEREVGGVIEASRELGPLLLVGAPLRAEAKLFNCALAIHRGRLLGVAVKSYLPNYREFYEKRYFAAARQAAGDTLRVAGHQAPFGADLVFEAVDYPGFRLHVEICEDLWTPVPPSTWAALGGATVLANLSASNVTIGKADFRRALCAAQSGRCLAAYLFAAAGPGESTTDLAWDGQALIYENAELLAEGERFPREGRMITADVDLERLRQERMRLTSFSDAVADHRGHTALRTVGFELDPPAGEIALERTVDRFPYVPPDTADLDERCYEAYEIQVQGLVKRLQATGIDKLVLGVSGGLDSTQALIVATKALDRLGLPRGNLLAYTLPGFATSERTRTNAWALMEALGVSAGEIDIRPSSRQMLADIGHPYASGEPVHDVTFENVQAGERTSHLFRLANFHGGLVVGTGDLSELALGWNTYGVGDQMSHYNVNGSVPKTLIQHLIRWVIKTGRFDAAALEVLGSILDTEISPELVPPSPDGREDHDGDGPAQSSEEVVGPFDLQDFHLYFVTRYGFRPSKIAFLAHHAWGDRERGAWPEALPEADRHEYDLATIKRWLRVFLHRFFALSQFKRSAMPNGPKVGSGGSLSPRGDWRAPSDAEARVWLDELDSDVPG
jgi:NAD+ synthase (glutamine-hydrolysing)